MKTLILIISFTIIILGTRDSLFAQNWFVAHTDTNRHFNSVFFTDANTGYATGAKFIPGGPFPLIYKTTNAGINWFEQTSPQSDSASFVFPDLVFTDLNTGYIAVLDFTSINNGRILKTTNGGINWSNVRVDKGMYNLCFVNSSTGYAVGNQVLLKTTDACTTWEDKHFPNFIRDIHFTDINTGYIVGDHGHIFKTTNGGTDWDRQKPTNLALTSVFFADANTGIAVGGLYNNTKNIILRTTNAGINWTQVTYTYSTCLLYSVRFINSTTGWILGPCSQIIKTTDGGANWFNQITPVGINVGFRNCFFTSALTGYIASGNNSTNTVGYILKTTDGGDEYSPLGIKPISNEVPAQFQLYQNYPNPFNPETRIRFHMPLSRGVDAEGGRGVFTKLIVYDILGRVVATLIDGQLNAGIYEVDWNASNYPSGVYYYRLSAHEVSGSSTGDGSASGFVETKKMVLMK